MKLQFIPNREVVQVGLVLLIIILIVLIYYRIKKTGINALGLTSSEQTRNYEESVDKIKASTNKKNLSYPVYDYERYANNLETAMKGIGHDRDVILEVFDKMKNLDDVKQLVASFGVRQGEDLNAWLINEYVTNNWRTIRTEVNNKLASKGINFSF